ncbi:hypothetical protein GGR56DRAFT_670702 [Xylariaceae sp. FL0804]|nr:hypothetical protein GGR56DRAFT_670702 [Xylariaceae sp. FL0804]
MRRSILAISTVALAGSVLGYYSPYEMGPVYLEVSSPTNASMKGYAQACFAGVPGTAGLCYVGGGDPTDPGGFGSPNHFLFNTTEAHNRSSGVLSSVYPTVYPLNLTGLGAFPMAALSLGAGSNVAALTLGPAGAAAGDDGDGDDDGLGLVVGFGADDGRMFRLGVDDARAAAAAAGPAHPGSPAPAPDTPYYDWFVCWMFYQERRGQYLAWTAGDGRAWRAGHRYGATGTGCAVAPTSTPRLTTASSDRRAKTTSRRPADAHVRPAHQADPVDFDFDIASRAMAVSAGSRTSSKTSKAPSWIQRGIADPQAPPTMRGDFVVSSSASVQSWSSLMVETNSRRWTPELRICFSPAAAPVSRRVWDTSQLLRDF